MESLEDIRSRHRKEQKDLQSRIMQKKKGASKKTRKGVNSECEELERQLKEKHEAELAESLGEATPDAEDVSDIDGESASSNPAPSMNEVVKSLETSHISEPLPSKDSQPKKRNRQKERQARRAAEQEAVVEEAKKEAANQPNPKDIERKKMIEQFKARELIEKPIRPDGHCLFSAVADQLSQVGIPIGAGSEAINQDQQYKLLRHAAARYMEGHPDEFVGWLDEPLDQYVEKIRDTAEWGGHLELLALAKAYNIQICVIQNGEPETIDPGSKDPEQITLAYYRHGFGLGEHYNSLRKSP